MARDLEAEKDGERDRGKEEEGILQGEWKRGEERGRGRWRERQRGQMDRWTCIVKDGEL